MQGEGPGLNPRSSAQIRGKSFCNPDFPSVVIRSKVFGFALPRCKLDHMATTLATRIELNFEGAVARVALSHPPVNVIDFAMMDDLMSALSAIEQHNEVSAIVLSGTGRGLSAGVDVT